MKRCLIILVANHLVSALTTQGQTWPDFHLTTGTYELPAVIHVALTGNDADDRLSRATAESTVLGGVDARFETGAVLVSNRTYVLSAETVANKENMVILH